MNLLSLWLAARTRQAACIDRSTPAGKVSLEQAEQISKSAKKNAKKQARSDYLCQILAKLKAR
jgi:hypothetical protein